MKLSISSFLTITALAVGASSANAKTLRWASSGDALTLDPHAQNESPTINMNKQFYETLVTRDTDLVLISALATEWKATSDTTWEFTLRKGVKFHDGADFTAEDVKFSLERASASSSDYKGYVKSIQSIEIVNDHKVVITTPAPDPIFPSYMTYIMMMDKGWAEKNNVVAPQNYNANEETYAVRNNNGTGPFILVSRDPDLKTVMKRNENYWGEKPQVDKVVYTPIKEASTRVAALLSGEVDLLVDPPLQDLDRLRSNEAVKIVSAPQIRTIFFGMDQSADKLRSNPDLGKNPLADQRVRKAMYMAIDAKAIQKKIMRGLSIPAGLITPPGVHGYSEDLDKRIGYDAKGAKKLLTEAGYPNGFSIRLDCPNNRYINDEAICQAAVSMLARIGIKVSLNAQPKSIHFKSLGNGESDFYMLGWGVTTLDSEYVFRYLINTRQEASGHWNHANFSNAKVDGLISSIQQELDVSKRDGMIREVWEIVLDDVTYLPIHHQVINWAMAKNVDIPIHSLNETLFKEATMD